MGHHAMTAVVSPSATGAPRPLRVLHVITRMIVGGAQENTMLSCALIDREQFPSAILCGAETGAEGELISESRARGVEVRIEPSLVRAIDPLRDVLAAWRLFRPMLTDKYASVHLHTSN